MKDVFPFISACVEDWPVFVAAGGHPEISGTLSTEIVPGTPLRTESRWGAPLECTSRFTLISVEETGASAARISRYHGDLVLSTPGGELIGQDRGLWDLDTGEFVSVYHVTSATGAYAGATGVFILTGTLDPARGIGLSHYRGVVTTSPQRSSSLASMHVQLLARWNEAMVIPMVSEVATATAARHGRA
jgi:hypothetical protein